MSTFISLTNELLRRLNEVQIDETDFTATRNIQALAKDSINSSVKEIIHSAQEFPFLLTTKQQTLTQGINEYSFPADTNSVDWESFYIKKHSSGSNVASVLKAIPYSLYLSQHRAKDDDGDEGATVFVFQTQDLKFGVSPVPDKNYIIEYKYWTFPSALASSTDSCIIPEKFNSVIIDGAMMFMMLFRSNEQSASIHRERFNDGIKSMRRVLLDEPLFMSSTMIIK